MNMTHMHLRTHTKPESLGQAGRWQSPYHDAMIDHDRNVGQLLDLLDELGIADDTIVIYSTDNGPHANSWPDGATTPFRSEKNTNWEGAFRIPEMIRWPGKIPAGVVSNEMIQHHDWFPTFLAAAGEPDIIEKLKNGHQIGDKEFKVHLDAFNLLPYLTGEVDKSPRPGFIYFSDDGDVLGVRYDNWKVVFMEQRCQGTLQVWAEPFVPLRVPKLFNLRTDPFERADITSNTYYDWMIDHIFLLFYAGAIVTQFLATFTEFPPRQEASSFTINQAVQKLHEAPGEGLGARILERRVDEVGDRRLRRSCRRGSRTRFARSGIRQRRHLVVREADVHPARFPHPAIRRTSHSRPVTAEPPTVPSRRRR
jgi:arylsulfatase